MTASPPLRVAWLVPGFPRDSTDSNYPFLGREARILSERPDVALLLVTESQTTGAGWPFQVTSINRPAGFGPKARALATVARHDPGRTGRSITRLRADYPTMWRIGETIDVLRRFQPDVVHSHFAVPNGSCGVSVARALRSAAVVSLRGVDLNVVKDTQYGFRLEPRYDAELRASLGNVDRCITATSRMRHRAIEAGAAAERCSVLHNSVAPLDLLGLPPADRPIGASAVIVSAGHLTVGKGFDRGIRALVDLPSTTHYDIVGEGPERGTLERLAAELGVERRVRLLGSRSPLETRARIADADCYWFLSRYEAFGNVLVEAYASGCRIVATPEGIAPDLIPNDPMGELLMEPDDPTELAQTTMTLLQREVVARPLRSLERFDPAAWANSLVSIYRQALSGGQRQSV